MGTTEPWAFGYQRFGNDKLPDHLLAVAKHRANRAIRGIDYDGRLSLHNDKTTIEWLDRAVDAGTAIEVFCKYVLATFSPVLLVKPLTNPGLDVLLHLTDNGNIAKSTTAMELTSRDASDCVDMIQQLSNRVTGAQPLGDTTVRDAKNVLKVRNSAIHLGMIERTILISSLMQFIDVMVELLKVAQLNPDDYWESDPSQTLANIGKNRPLSGRVDGKIKVAHMSIKGKAQPSPELSPEALRGVTPIPDAIIADAPTPSVPYEHQKIVPCPVCKQSAVLWGVEYSEGVMEVPLKIDEVPPEELENLHEGEELTTFVIPVNAAPKELGCSFCQLHLIGDEILEIGLVEREIKRDWFVRNDEPSLRAIEHYEEWKMGIL